VPLQVILGQREPPPRALHPRTARNRGRHRPDGCGAMRFTGGTSSPITGKVRKSRRRRDRRRGGDWASVDLLSEAAAVRADLVLDIALGFEELSIERYVTSRPSGYRTTRIPYLRLPWFRIEIRLELLERQRHINVPSPNAGSMSLKTRRIKIPEFGSFDLPC